MKNIQNKWQKCITALFGFLLVCFIASACVVSQSKNDEKNESDKSEMTSKTGGATEKSNSIRATATPEDPRVAICKRYEECKCQSFESCMEQLEDDPTPDEPGIKECILASSCKSLCAGKPDCGGKRPKDSSPERSNCSQITCTKNSDCPGDCHGGCSEGRCYMF